MRSTAGWVRSPASRTNKLSPPDGTIRWRVLQALVGMAAHLLRIAKRVVSNTRDAGEFVRGVKNPQKEGPLVIRALWVQNHAGRASKKDKTAVMSLRFVRFSALLLGLAAALVGCG